MINSIRTIEDIVQAAFIRTKALVSSLYTSDKKINKHKKRVRNRQALYYKKLRLGKKL